MARQALLGGSVHINCPFPEPLYSAGDEAIYQPIYNQFSVGVSKLGRIPKFTKD